MVLAATVVVTGVGVAAVTYGLAGWYDVVDEFVLVAAFALLFIGGPAVFMWFNTLRVLSGSPSAAWRVQKHLSIVISCMLLIGVGTLFSTAQFVALSFLAGGLVVLVACALGLKWVLGRDRVPAPPPNWHDRLAAEETARRR
jgi:hypothetical protein